MRFPALLSLSLSSPPRCRISHRKDGCQSDAAPPQTCMVKTGGRTELPLTPSISRVRLDLTDGLRLRDAGTGRRSYTQGAKKRNKRLRWNPTTKEWVSGGEKKRGLQGVRICCICSQSLCGIKPKAVCNGSMETETFDNRCKGLRNRCFTSTSIRDLEQRTWSS